MTRNSASAPALASSLFGYSKLIATGTWLASFFFNDPATPGIYTLSLHDALPISDELEHLGEDPRPADAVDEAAAVLDLDRDRESTRLNSSHVSISYAVFCLK